MPDSPLIAAGAQVAPIAAAPLHTNRMFTGLWTQRSPLRDAATPYLEEKFYQATRFDSLLGGVNMEVSPRLTKVRRPGNSVYNTNPIPPVDRFYEFRAFNASGEVIHLMADCVPATGFNFGTVRDMTGPSTNLTIFNKATNAGRTSFQAVGNTLYFCDGVDQKKWVQSSISWAPNTAFPRGSFIVDTNNNLQLSMGAQTATIVDIQVQDIIISNVGPTHGRLVTLFLSPSTPLAIENNISLTLAGLTTVPAANGVSPATVIAVSSIQVQIVYGTTGIPVTGLSTETGTVTTGTGISGGAAPAWNVTQTLSTQDGTNQWTNMGPAVQNWGFAGPAGAPTVTQAVAPTAQTWVASTWYAPLFVILDTNNNLQQLTTAGTTGTVQPTWNVVVGGTTLESVHGGTAVWTNLGPSTWTRDTAYTAGQCIQATFTYYITTTTTTYMWNGFTNVPVVTVQNLPVTATALFQCINSGTTGNNQPSWPNGLGAVVNDGTVGWKNQGQAQLWTFIGASQTLSLNTSIVDSNGNTQLPQLMGESGAAAPMWNKTQGSTTAETGPANPEQWLNNGPFNAGNTGTWQWAYSGKNSITGQISTASPLSAPLLVAAGKLAVIQGVGPLDPQEDTIVLWRTLQGGGVLFFDDQFPNPGAGRPWIFTDTNSDAQINELISAPINSTNNPPPTGFLPQAYFDGRIWGFVNNNLVASNGPATVVGNGNESFSPSNTWPLSSLGITCWSTPIGLVVFRIDGISIVFGSGTSSSPYYVRDLYDNIGLASQDNIDFRGDTAFLMTSTAKVIKLTTAQILSVAQGGVQQSLEELEIGFPIGDVLQAEYTPSNSYVTFHEGPSEDSALYVGDGAIGWYRGFEVVMPEQCFPWAPQAQIVGGVQAIKSIETTPGNRRLLLGPATQGGRILQRDYSTNQDNGVSYPCDIVFGNVILAQPGTLSSVQFIGTDCLAIGSDPIVSLLFDEIAGTPMVLTEKRLSDPVNQDPSVTVPARRFFAKKNGKSINCRHLQVTIAFPAENAANELLTYTIYGRLPEKARK